MHELSLTEALVALVEDEARRHGCSRVRTVRVELGSISAIEPEAMRFCFDAVTRGTLADGAELDIITVPARGWCADCGKEVALRQRLDACPDCGAAYVRPVAGDDMRLKELEAEESDIIIDKRRFSAFFKTDLDQTLRTYGVDTVAIGGLNTHFCVLATARGWSAFFA